MKETKTLEFFDEYDFENQNNQERTDVHQLLGGEIWYNWEVVFRVWIFTLLS